MGDKSKLKIGTYQNPNSGRSKESIDNYVKGMREKKYGGKKLNTDRVRKIGMLTGGQAKIAAKAPPPNKIDEKDFAVLRAEKAKGKRMGGSMMKKYSKGGGADSGRIGEMKSRLAVAADRVDGLRKGRGKLSPRALDKIKERTKTYALAQSMKDKDRLTDRDIKKASSLVKGKMGGGMVGSMQTPMQRPMAMSGYKKGTMVKARGCKLGRTRPTKIT
jgi:hypothetical protein